MHFIATCANYKEMHFNVAALRPFYEKKGMGKHSTWLKFVGGVYDSKADGLDVKEAEVARKALERCTLHGARIEFTQPTIGEDDGKHGIR